MSFGTNESTRGEQEDILPTGFYERFLKRWLDVTLTCMAFPIVLPLIFLIALLVRFDGGPAFFTQDRVGRDGRVFRIFKLRSMVVNAEDLLAAHLRSDPALHDEWKKNQKLKADPRITFLGRYLRKSSLDELPQLFNVLKGDMSIVGPRPILPEQRSAYTNSAYYTLRPGITGPWQVSTRNAVSFSGRAEFDIQYAQRVSLWNDLRIIALTGRAILRGTGY